MEVYVVAVNMCIALVPVLLAVGDARLVPLNKYADGITRIHNNYRYQENATNMQMLVRLLTSMFSFSAVSNSVSNVLIG